MYIMGHNCELGLQKLDLLNYVKSINHLNLNNTLNHISLNGIVELSFDAMHNFDNNQWITSPTQIQNH